jgi:hypothetical protein
VVNPPKRTWLHAWRRVRESKPLAAAALARRPLAVDRPVDYHKLTSIGRHNSRKMVRAMSRDGLVFSTAENRRNPSQASGDRLGKSSSQHYPGYRIRVLPADCRHNGLDAVLNAPSDGGRSHVRVSTRRQLEIAVDDAGARVLRTRIGRIMGGGRRMASFPCVVGSPC